MKRLYLILFCCIATMHYAQDSLPAVLIVEKVKGQTTAWLVEGLPKDATIQDLKKAFETKSSIPITDQHFMRDSKHLPNDVLISKAIPAIRTNSFQYPYVVLLRNLKE